MKHSEFETILKNRITKIENVLRFKAKEYATEDRLHNFKKAAEILGCIPEKALLGMKTKHDVSVLDIVDDIDKNVSERFGNPKYLSVNLIEEKIGDSINYLILLEALIKERMGVKEELKKC